jgi:hypothetical protein
VFLRSDPRSARESRRPSNLARSLAVAGGSLGPGSSEGVGGGVRSDQSHSFVLRSDLRESRRPSLALASTPPLARGSFVGGLGPSLVSLASHAAPRSFARFFPSLCFTPDESRLPKERTRRPSFGPVNYSGDKGYNIEGPYGARGVITIIGDNTPSHCGGLHGMQLVLYWVGLSEARRVRDPGGPSEPKR